MANIKQIVNKFSGVSDYYVIKEARKMILNHKLALRKISRMDSEKTYFITFSRVFINYVGIYEYNEVPDFLKDQERFLWKIENGTCKKPNDLVSLPILRRTIYERIYLLQDIVSNYIKDTRSGLTAQ